MGKVTRLAGNPKRQTSKRNPSGEELVGIFGPEIFLAFGFWDLEFF
jgi:hypothetical protein